MEKIKPIILNDEEHNQKYTLEFNRNAVVWCEAQGFMLQDFQEGKNLYHNLEILWQGAFECHHHQVSMQKRMSLLDDIGGLTAKVVTRLVELFNVPYTTLLNGEDEVKNSTVVVEI